MSSLFVIEVPPGKQVEILFEGSRWLFGGCWFSHWRARNFKSSEGSDGISVCCGLVKDLPEKERGYAEEPELLKGDLSVERFELYLNRLCKFRGPILRGCVYSNKQRFFCGKVASKFENHWHGWQWQCAVFVFLFLQLRLNLVVLVQITTGPSVAIGGNL